MNDPSTNKIQLLMSIYYQQSSQSLDPPLFIYDFNYIPRLDVHLFDPDNALAASLCLITATTTLPPCNSGNSHRLCN